MVEANSCSVGQLSDPIHVRLGQFTDTIYAQLGPYSKPESWDWRVVVAYFAALVSAK